MPIPENPTGTLAASHWQNWPMSTIDTALLAWWLDQPEIQTDTLAVAFSGGADSTALLLGALRLCLQGINATPARFERPFPHRIVALHVHHGLQASADAFASHCTGLCQSLQKTIIPPIKLETAVLPVQVVCAQGESVEAQARQARYRALAQAAQTAGARAVLLGHHAGDQAESVLLALSRGSGMAGWAGMAANFVRHGMRFARPLLHLEQKTLKQWLQTHQIPWVDDPSNTDQRFTRNCLRHTALPLLEEHLPGFGHSLVRSARLAAQADALLQDLAQMDLQQVGNPPQIARVRQLPALRQANVLRHWLKQEYAAIGSESQLLALQRVLAACTTRGHRIHIKVGGGFVEHNGSELVWRPLQS